MRLIDADAAIDRYYAEYKKQDICDGGEDRDWLKRCIDEASIIEAEPVVRCKDCKHFCPYEGEEHKGDCDELVGLESCVYEDDFCSYGERRADE